MHITSTSILVGVFPIILNAIPLDSASSHLDIHKRSFSVPAKRLPSIRNDHPMRRREVGAAFSNYTGGAWMVPVTIGTQHFTIFVDTGSADFWVYGSDIPFGELDGQHVYSYRNSSTAEQLQGQTFNIGYGDGSAASGVVVTDRVSVGTVSVPHQAIGVANDVRGNFVGASGHDGLMGLAFKGGNSIRPDQQPTWMENLVKFLPEPVFAMNWHVDATGVMDFGYVDETKYIGSLETVRCNNNSDSDYSASWTIDRVGFMADERSLPGGDMPMVVDTGGTTTTISRAPLYAYYELVDGAIDTHGDGTNWQVPCNTTLPDLSFVFPDDGVTAVIPGKQLLRDHENGNCESLLTIEQASPRGSVGDPFFFANYVLFNQSDATVRFAPQALWDQPDIGCKVCALILKWFKLSW